MKMIKAISDAIATQLENTESATIEVNGDGFIVTIPLGAMMPTEYGRIADEVASEIYNIAQDNHYELDDPPLALMVENDEIVLKAGFYFAEDEG